MPFGFHTYFDYIFSCLRLVTNYSKPVIKLIEQSQFEPVVIIDPKWRTNETVFTSSSPKSHWIPHRFFQNVLKQYTKIELVNKFLFSNTHFFCFFCYNSQFFFLVNIKLDDNNWYYKIYIIIFI
jgi:hypothetical protein